MLVFPGQDVFPNCFYRFTMESIACNQIPKEEVLLPSREASTILATLARSHNFTQVPVGSIGSTELLFETPPDVGPFSG